jgi:hypothetical protein
MAVTRWNRAQLVGKRVHWLLDLVFAGRVVRCALEDLTVTSTKLGDLQYAGCLEPFNVPLSLDLFIDSASLLSVKIAGVLPVNVPKLVAEGHDLGSATGVLSQWIEGTDYEERRIVLRGRVRDPEYSAQEEPVNFALEDNLYDDQGLIPELTAAVTFDTWGVDDGHGSLMYFSLNDSEKGLAYPVVFGNPGKVSTAIASSGWVTGSQGVWALHIAFDPGAPHNLEGFILILAGHRVTAEFVYMNTNDAGGQRFQIQHRTDALGREVAYIDAEREGGGYSGTDSVGDFYGLGHNSLDPSFQPNDGEDKPVFVGWYDPINPTTGGGMKGADGKTVRGAGDVLEAVLNFSTMAIDRARVAAVKSLLNRFKIDAVIETGTKPWDWIRANLLPILPVSVLKGPEGVYFVVWRYDATAADAIGHIDADADASIEVAETIKYDTSKILNSFSLKYALSIRTGNYTATATLGAKYDSGTPGSGVSYHCELSQRRYRIPGEGPNSGVYIEEIESPVVYDDDTANAILAWRALAFCFAKRTLELLVPEAEWAWLERGNVVLVSVSWLYLSKQVAIVEEIESGDDGMIGLRLLLIEDPARDSRRTS